MFKEVRPTDLWLASINVAICLGLKEVQALMKYGFSSRNHCVPIACRAECLSISISDWCNSRLNIWIVNKIANKTNANCIHYIITDVFEMLELLQLGLGLRAACLSYWTVNMWCINFASYIGFKLLMDLKHIVIGIKGVLLTKYFQ